ncbi:MAG: heme ABC exporter ATP-binding protein CcmA [Symbiobacteriia bacterium]
MAIDAPMIEARHLAKRYGERQVLEDVTFKLEQGRCLALFGPNGAGKSTLLKLLSLLTTPTSGELYLAGQRVGEEQGALRRRIGVLSHQSFLYDALSARENLLFYAQLYAVPRPAERVDSLLGQVGLTLFAGDPVRTFSRGMVQRLTIARVLLHEPQLLLLDEPYTGLDQSAAAMLDRVVDAAKAAGTTVVLISHDFAEGLRAADRAAILHRGGLRYLSDGKVEAAEFEQTYHRLVG